MRRNNWRHSLTTLVGFLYLGTLMAGEPCPRLTELWGESAGSRCSDRQSVTVLDMVAEMAGLCPCPGEVLEFADTVHDDGGLGGAVSVVVSPYGQNCYVAGTHDNAVTVFHRNAQTLTTTYLESHRNGVRGVSGLNGVFDLVLTPDGKHLYAAGSQALVAFQRNEADGALRFLRRYRSFEDGIEGLSQPSSVTLSPDGNHLYTTDAFDHALAVFRRNPESGLLTFVTAYYDGRAGVDGLGGAREAIVSPDGGHVFAVGDEDPGIAVFTRDEQTGELSFIRMERDGFRDGGSGYALAFSPTGDHLYMTVKTTSALAVYEHSSNHDLHIRQFITSGFMDFPGEPAGFFGAHDVVVSPNGSHVYVSGPDENAFAAFFRDASTGRLSFDQHFSEQYSRLDGLSGASGLAVSPDGFNLYVAAASSATVMDFRRRRNSGFLDPNGPLPVPDGLAGVTAAAVSPDGKHVYTAGSEDDAVGVFERDAESGTLRFLEAIRKRVDRADVLYDVNDLAISPDGNHLYTISGEERTLAKFNRNAESGTLHPGERHRNGRDGVDGLDGAADLVIANDGRFVYIAGAADNAVAVFRRETRRGGLEFLEAKRLDNSAVGGLSGVVALALSNDGRHLYAASPNDHAVTVFQIDPTTGMLTFVTMVRDGVSGVDGLEAVRSLVLAPDGRFLYAAGKGENALAVFQRDPTDGTLSFVTVVRDRENGVSGLNGAHHVAMTPDGTHLLVAAHEDHAVTVFQRDTETGRLQFVEVFRNQERGVNGLFRPGNLVFSPNGRQVYGTANDALVRFSLVPPL